MIHLSKDSLSNTLKMMSLPTTIAKPCTALSEISILSLRFMPQGISDSLLKAQNSPTVRSAQKRYVYRCKHYIPSNAPWPRIPFQHWAQSFPHKQ